MLLKSKIILILVVGGIFSTGTVFAIEYEGGHISVNPDLFLELLPGVEYLGFSNNQDKTNYDAKIVLSGDDELKIEGAGLQVSDGDLQVSDGDLQVSGIISSSKQEGNTVTINQNPPYASIILRNNEGYTPFINFVNDRYSSSDAAIVLSDDNLLEVRDAGLQVSGPISSEGDLQVSGEISAETISAHNIIMPSDGTICIGSCSDVIEYFVGEIQWNFYDVSPNRNYFIKLIDPDMNLDPDSAESVDINVWSDSDSGGIDITLRETGDDIGIFQGAIYFTLSDESSGYRLRVAEGDTVTAEYNDNTLPSSSIESESAITDSIIIDFYPYDE